MTGTPLGGIKARDTNIKKYGEDFYRIQGAKGGRAGRGPNYTGGFAADPERARRAGAKGGRNSKRGLSAEGQKVRIFLEASATEIVEMRRLGANCKVIAQKLGLPYRAVYLWVRKRERG